MTNILPPHGSQHVTGGADALSGLTYAQLTLTGGIVNADVASGAAVAYSKLALTGSILDADNAGEVIHYRKFLYDFSVLGGAVSTLTLTATDGSALAIPAYSTIRRSTVRVITGVTSVGSLTLALGDSVNGTTSLMTATGKASLGATAVFDNSAAVYASASGCNITATIGTAAATAGKLVVLVHYMPGTATL